MFKILKTNHTKCCQDLKELYTAGSGVSLYNHSGKLFGITE